MTMRVFTLQNALFIFVGLRLVVLIAETFERLRILFILSTIIVHSCFTSCIFAARTLDFAVKFRLVFRYETVVFRRYVLALLLVSLLRKFEAYLVYLSLIQSKNPRRFSFFQKFLHFTYMLLWFQFVIPSFPARIDDMRSRFSALSPQAPALSLFPSLPARPPKHTKPLRRREGPRENQSRAQSSQAPRSAVGRRGELWGHEGTRNRAVPVLVRMLGFDVIRRKNGSHHEVNFSLFQPLYDRERRYFC